MSGYDLPPSPFEGRRTQLWPTVDSESSIDGTSKPLSSINTSQEEDEEDEEDWEGCEEEAENQEQEVDDDENEVVLPIDASSLVLSHKESLFLKEAHESLGSSSSSISKSSEMEDFIVKSETQSLPSPVSPCPFSLLMGEENEDDKMPIEKDSALSNIRRKQERRVQVKRISSLKTTRDDDDEEEASKWKVKKEKQTEQSTSKLFLHHEKDAVFAIEMGHQHTTDPRDIFLEYQLHRGHERREKLEECLSYLVEKSTQREAYRRRKEQIEEESLTALMEVDEACHDLKTRLMEV